MTVHCGELKKLLVAFNILFSLSGLSSAQTVQLDSVPVTSFIAENGLYKSSQDFERRHTVFSFSGTHTPYHWQANSMFDSFISWPVKLVTPDSIIRASELTYWGCRSSGKDYRFYGRDVYQIVVKDGLILYEHKDYGVEMVVLYGYYFSVSAQDPILYLNRKNLQTAFANNPDMLQLLRTVKRPGNWIRPVPPHNRPLILELYRLSVSK